MDILLLKDELSKGNQRKNCTECGKTSDKDGMMRRLCFNNTSVCLCQNCFKTLSKKIITEYKKDEEAEKKRMAQEPEYILWIMEVGDGPEERVIYKGNELTELEDAVFQNQDEVINSNTDKYFELITKKSSYAFYNYRDYLKKFRMM